MRSHFTEIDPRVLSKKIENLNIQATLIQSHARRIFAVEVTNKLRSLKYLVLTFARQMLHKKLEVRIRSKMKSITAIQLKARKNKEKKIKNECLVFGFKHLNSVVREVRFKYLVYSFVMVRDWNIHDQIEQQFNSDLFEYE